MLLGAALLLALAPGRAAYAQAAPADHAEHHIFVMPSFTFEDGTTLPQTKVSYGTYGRLNPKKDNVILLPSSYMADHHDNDWLQWAVTYPDFVDRISLQARTWGATRGRHQPRVQWQHRAVPPKMKESP